MNQWSAADFMYINLLWMEYLRNPRHLYSACNWYKHSNHLILTYMQGQNWCLNKHLEIEFLLTEALELSICLWNRLLFPWQFYSYQIVFLLEKLKMNFLMPNQLYIRGSLFFILCNLLKFSLIGSRLLWSFSHQVLI